MTTTAILHTRTRLLGVSSSALEESDSFRTLVTTSYGLSDSKSFKGWRKRIVSRRRTYQASYRKIQVRISNLVVETAGSTWSSRWTSVMRLSLRLLAFRILNGRLFGKALDAIFRRGMPEQESSMKIHNSFLATPLLALNSYTISDIVGRHLCPMSSTDKPCAQMLGRAGG